MHLAAPEVEVDVVARPTTPGYRLVIPVISSTVSPGASGAGGAMVLGGRPHDRSAAASLESAG